MSSAHSIQKMCENLTATKKPLILGLLPTGGWACADQGSIDLAQIKQAITLPNILFLVQYQLVRDLIKCGLVTTVCQGPPGATSLHGNPDRMPKP
jgi:hypothetical protein